MPEDIIEDDLLRSIDEIDAQIKNFRQRVQAVLVAAQGDGNPTNTKHEAGGVG